MSGVIPDSRAPTWLVLVGGRYSAGYGKMMIGGFFHAIHFQPQAFLQVGMHVHDGSFGPSGLTGIGLLVHATPRWFFRVDGGMTAEIRYEICTRFCDHAFTAESGDNVMSGWMDSPFCLGPPSKGGQ